MKKWLILCILTILAGLWAQDFDFSTDEFFQSDLLEEETEPDDSFSDAFSLFEMKGLTISGEMENSLEFTYLFRDWDDRGEDSVTPLLDYRLNFDGRPNERFRAYGSFGVRYPFEETQQPSGDTLSKGLTVQELFSDINWDNKIFLRAGKQRVRWGTGYFFNSIDILSREQIDLNNVEAAREGPVALKFQYPISQHQLTLFVVTDESEENNRWKHIAYGPRMDFLLGNFEVSLYGYYKAYQATRGMLSFTGPLPGVRGFKIFGEGVLMEGSDKNYVDRDLQIYERNEAIFSGTLGFRYQNSRMTWADILTIGQYYYNGEGYSYSKPFSVLSGGSFPIGGTLEIEDFFFPGQHYSGFMLNLSDLGNTGFGTNLMWYGNWTDHSGWVVPSITWRPTRQKLEAFSVEFGTRFYYGSEGTEFRRSNSEMRTLNVFLEFSLGTGDF